MARNKEKKLLSIFKEEFSLFYQKVANNAQRQVLKNMKSGKDVNGDNFAKLTKYTRDERKRLGYTGPILERTKNLRNSIKFIADTSSMSITSDSLDYGDYLNDGRSDMEPRRILEFPKEWDVDGSEMIKSLSKTHERTMKRLEDFTDVYRNAER